MEKGTLKAWHIILFAIALFIILPTFGEYLKDEFLLAKKQFTQDKHPVQTYEVNVTEKQEPKETKKEETGSLASHEVVEEEDISYGGCKRLAVRIVMDDSANQTDAKFIVKSVVESYSSWDEVTVWGWGFSERSEVGASMFTKGMYEKGSCR